MKKVSTSTLAKIKNIQPANLFESLQSWGYIIRNNNVWDLTEFWKSAWWEIEKSERFGKYIVWPEDIDIKTPTKSIVQKSIKQINATIIGEFFHTSSQRLNLVLSELGLIEKDVAGWKITKLGKNLWGTEHKHIVSWAYYVLWNESILTYPRLLEVFNQEKVSALDEKKQESVVVSVPVSIQSNGFREKFEAKHRTQDGHYVRSKAEMIIDNLLYQYGIVHAYERKLPIEEDVYSDFYIPPGNWRPQWVYIEYWGLENEEKYLDRKKKKLAIYKENELALIELNEADVQNLDDVLPRKLLNFKIKVY